MAKPVNKNKVSRDENDQENESAILQESNPSSIQSGEVKADDLQQVKKAIGNNQPVLEKHKIENHPKFSKFKKGE